MEFGQILGKQATFSFSYKIRVNYHLKTPRCSNFTSNNLGQNLHTTSGLVPFQFSVVVYVVSSAFEAKILPENNLILSSEPLICGTIYEGVYGATQVKQKAVC